MHTISQRDAITQLITKKTSLERLNKKNSMKKKL